MTVPTFTAKAERAIDGMWSITVEELPGLLTQARRLAVVPDQTAAAIKLMVEAEEFDVIYNVQLPLNGAETYYDTLASALETLTASKMIVDAMRPKFCLAAKNAGWSNADIATFLHLSPQRISQILKGEG